MAANGSQYDSDTANDRQRQPVTVRSDGRWPAARLAFTDESLAGMA